MKSAQMNRVPNGAQRSESDGERDDRDSDRDDRERGSDRGRGRYGERANEGEKEIEFALTVLRPLIRP